MREVRLRKLVPPFSESKPYLRKPDRRNFNKKKQLTNILQLKLNMLKFTTSCALVLASALAIQLTSKDAPSNADPTTTADYLRDAHQALSDVDTDLNNFDTYDWEDTLDHIEF